MKKIKRISLCICFLLVSLIPAKAQTFNVLNLDTSENLTSILTTNFETVTLWNAPANQFNSFGQLNRVTLSGTYDIPLVDGEIVPTSLSVGLRLGEASIQIQSTPLSSSYSGTWKAEFIFTETVIGSSGHLKFLRAELHIGSNDSIFTPSSNLMFTNFIFVNGAVDLTVGQDLTFLAEFSNVGSIANSLTENLFLVEQYPGSSIETCPCFPPGGPITDLKIKKSVIR